MKVEEPAKDYKIEIDGEGEKSLENGDGIYLDRNSQNNKSCIMDKSNATNPITSAICDDDRVKILTRKKKESFNCDVCRDQFNFIEELEEHLLVLHRDKKIYKCITCKAKFLDQTVLHAHLSNCSGKFLYLCFHCGEDFMYISQYESHVEIHSGENLFHDNTEPSFYTLCFQCGEEFTDKEQYSTHKSKEILYCKYCSQSFCSNRDKREEHMSYCSMAPMTKFGYAISHVSTSNLKSNTGTFSDRNASNTTPLKTTESKTLLSSTPSCVLSPGNNINGNYDCIDCLESFNNFTDLTEHQKIHENEPYMFNCKCGSEFFTNLALKEHVQLEDDEENHVEIKPFICQFCDKAFGHPGHYKRHQLVHNKIAIKEKKKFPCPECGKEFDKQYSLDVHFRLHSGDRPFVCDICGKGFVAKKRLNRHKKIHLRNTHNGGI